MRVIFKQVELSTTSFHVGESIWEVIKEVLLWCILHQADYLTPTLVLSELKPPNCIMHFFLKKHMKTRVLQLERLCSELLIFMLRCLFVIYEGSWVRECNYANAYLADYLRRSSVAFLWNEVPMEILKVMLRCSIQNNICFNQARHIRMFENHTQEIFLLITKNLSKRVENLAAVS